ncbi:MAG: hypothetical protein Q3962_07835 [Corynebacterium sp.]|nr:hypothetical protein [Corynebacterium sp.]
MFKKLILLGATLFLTACAGQAQHGTIATGSTGQEISIPEVKITLNSCTYAQSFPVKSGYEDPPTARYVLIDASFTSTSTDQSYNPVRYLIAEAVDTQGNRYSQVPINQIAGNPSVDTADNLQPGGHVSLRYAFKIPEDAEITGLRISDQWFDFNSWAEISTRCLGPQAAPAQ